MSAIGDILSSSPLTASHQYYYLYLNNVTNVQGRPLVGGNSYYMYFTTGTASVSTAPTIVAVGPPDNSTGAGVNTLMLITFSGPIDPITVNASIVPVSGGSQTVVPSSISFNTAFTLAAITPQAPLPANTLMTFTINGVTDAEGDAVGAQTTHFTTGTGPVLTNPSVVLSSYQNGDTIPTNAVFRCQFDRQMDPGTVNSTTFFFCDNSVGCQQGNASNVVTLSSDLMTETLTLPSGTLISGHSVYVNSSGAQDLTGNVQNAFNAGVASIGSTPDTTPPVVLETNPPANLTGVPTNVSIQIEFSKEISDTSTGSVQLLQDSTPVPVTTSFSRLSTVLALTPTVPLAANTPYTISILGVQDITGNTMSGTKVVSFTNGPAVKLNHPNLALVS